MRNFDDTMNEIRSRSKARIVKRRKQFGSVCMGVVVCVTVVSLWVLPVNKPADTSYMQQPTISGLYDHDVIDVTNQQNIQIRCSVETSEKMFSFLSEMDENSTRTAQIGMHTYNTTAAQEASGSKPSYTITVTDKQGSTKVFALKGNLLQDLQTSTIYALNSAQYQKLYKLIGLDRITDEY